MLSSNYWLPPDVSTHGQRMDGMINFIHLFMIVLFVGWGVFFVYCLIRFRQRAGQKAQYEPVKAKLSKYAEVGVVVVETILLLFFSIPIWQAYKTEPPPRDADPLEVRVVAQQFAWNIHYPGEDGKFGPTDPNLVHEQENPIGLDRDHEHGADDVVTLNNMHVPVGKPVVARLTSKDVIHSFWLPHLRVKQDTIPGMEIPIWFTPTQTSDQIREQVTRSYELPDAADAQAVERFLKRTRTSVAMADYMGPKGATILSKGQYLSEDIVAQLKQAGVEAVSLSPKHPMEIHCAQLCGLNHYSMRGFFISQTAADYAKFMAEEAEGLQDEDDMWGDEEEDEEETG